MAPKDHLVSLFFFLTSCASYQPRALSPATTAAVFEARSLDDRRLHLFVQKNIGHAILPWPPADWNFTELTLVAFYFHPDLDMARAQWATARAGMQISGQRPNPTLTLGPNEFVSNAAGISPWVLGFSLDIPIETAGKRGIRRRQAAAIAETARMNIAQTAWQIRSQARRHLLAIYAAQQSKEILEDKQKDLEINLRLLNDRSASGQASSFNAAQAAILFGKNRLDLADVERRQSEARIKLAGAVGLPAAAFENFPISSSSFPALADPQDPVLALARRTALLSRSDLLGALAHYAASEAALELEIARQFPDLHFGPGFAYDQKQDKWGLSLALPLPIFHRNNGAIAQAQAGRQEAADQFLALQDQLINDIDLALAGYRLAYEKLKTADEVFEAHLEQDGKIRRLLRPGDVSRLILFRSQLDIADSKLAHIDAWVEARQALGSLEDSLQHSFGWAALPQAAIEENPRENENKQ